MTIQLSKTEIINLVETSSPRIQLNQIATKSKYLPGFQAIELDGQTTRFMKCRNCEQILWNAKDNRKTIRAHWRKHHVDNLDMTKFIKDMDNSPNKDAEDKPDQICEIGVSSPPDPPANTIVVPQWDPILHTFQGVLYRKIAIINGSSSI